MFLSLVNNKSNSPLNLISSGNRGATFSHDTTGLKNDQFGTGIITKLLEHQGKVFALNNFQTLYSKEVSVALAERQTVLFEMYPNPASDVLRLTFVESASKQVRVHNRAGQLILQSEIPPSGEISISSLLPGFYWLEVDGTVRSFVKN